MQALVGIFSKAYSQSLIKGKITDQKGVAVPYAIVFLKKTTQGTSTDTSGFYEIKTSEKGKQILSVNSIGYDTTNYAVTLEEGKTYEVNLKFKDSQNTLDEIVIGAGAFDANNDMKVAMLRPSDIYSTAGSSGDIVGAIQMLPGTQKVGDQSGLFVRGGDASESATIVDGMIIQNAFMSGVPGVSQRSRFAPFQFKGVSFSSGGYSARYGQALSGILELNTNDLPEKTTLSANINMAGASFAAGKRWKMNALEGSLNYTNLRPFYGITKTNFNFYAPPTGWGGSTRWVMMNDKKDLLKLFVNASGYESGTDIINPRDPKTTLAFGLKNDYLVINGYYRKMISSKVYATLASSYSYNKDKVTWGTANYDKNDFRGQGRGEIISDFSSNLSGFAGVEVQHFGIKQIYDTLSYSFTETITAGYAEAEWKPRRWFGLKPGIRYEYSNLLQNTAFSPRLSAALLVHKNAQVSLASGLFYQNAVDKYLLVGQRPKFQQAVHYIANYQWTTEDRTFRVEGFYKSYAQLVKEQTSFYNPNPYRVVSTLVTSEGSGYAGGIDVFFKDRASIKNFDYWISYSYIDTKRLYENFQAMATPNFISDHNLNVVAKYLFQKPGINVSATYSYASGRPYFNPNNANFLGDRAPAYHNLAVTLSYLFTLDKFFGVFYISMDNILNNQNVLGYRYSYPDLAKYTIQPAMYRSVFAGVFISLTPFKKEEL